MTSRREFMHYTGAAIAAMSTSLPATAETMQLPTRPIPATGEPLPIVGLGNGVAFGSGDTALTRQLLDILMERGGAYVDTSVESRYTVAEVMREKGAQDRLFLGTYVEDQEEAAIRRDIDGVLAAQGDGSPLDLLLTRNIDYYVAERDLFRTLKDEGHTRYIGVARHQAAYHERMMQLIAGDAIDFLQVNYSMLEPEAAERLLPMARDRGVAVIINRPFVNGDYFSIVRGHSLPEWAAEFDCDSWAQFSLKYILSHPAVNCVLTETSNPRHAIDNIGGGMGRMPDEKTRQRMRALIEELA